VSNLHVIYVLRRCFVITRPTQSSGISDIEHPGALTYGYVRGRQNAAMNKGSDLASRAQGSISKRRRPFRILVADEERDTVLSLMMLLRQDGHACEASTLAGTS
jgi:hypothetical protein